jgi:SPP1 family predicted phage head-tail adaptor
MRAGRLNSRVSLLAQPDSQDSIGQPVTTWTSYADVWADIRTQSGLETVRGNAAAAVVKTSIRIRRRADVKADHRVQHGTDMYTIKAVLPDKEGRQYVDLVCEVLP